MENHITRRPPEYEHRLHNWSQPTVDIQLKTRHDCHYYRTKLSDRVWFSWSSMG